jgi:hypothetical protein
LLIRKNDISLSVKLIAPRIPPQSRAIFPTNLKIPPFCPSSARTATSLLAESQNIINIFTGKKEKRKGIATKEQNNININRPFMINLTITLCGNYRPCNRHGFLSKTAHQTVLALFLCSFLMFGTFDVNKILAIFILIFLKYES